VPGPLGVVDEEVDPPFQHPLEVLLHLLAVHVHEDGQRGLPSLGQGIHVRAITVILPSSISSSALMRSSSKARVLAAPPASR
jgi:hypothetical protein